MPEAHKTYNSIVAAKYLLALANEMGIILNATQMQKLLFIAYGYVLANEGFSLCDETPKAWPFGPVFPRVQKKVTTDKVIILSDPDLSEIKMDQYVTKLFTDVISKYHKFSASQLSNWSHMKDSPWEKTTKMEGFKWNQYIPDEYITSYFLDFDVR